MTKTTKQQCAETEVEAEAAETKAGEARDTPHTARAKAAQSARTNTVTGARNRTVPCAPPAESKTTTPSSVPTTTGPARDAARRRKSPLNPQTGRTHEETAPTRKGAGGRGMRENRSTTEELTPSLTQTVTAGTATRKSETAADRTTGA